MKNWGFRSKIGMDGDFRPERPDAAFGAARNRQFESLRMQAQIYAPEFSH